MELRDIFFLLEPCFHSSLGPEVPIAVVNITTGSLTGTAKPVNRNFEE